MKIEFNQHKDMEKGIYDIELRHTLRDRVMKLKQSPFENFDFKTLHLT